MTSNTDKVNNKNTGGTDSAPEELLFFKEYGSGPPLLLIHGLMITGEMFEPVIKHFASQHRVIVPDLRGHGRSRKLPPPYTPIQLASDLSHLLDYLGIESASVLGYSNGGAIAQQLVLDYPKRCNRLVLACSYAFNMLTFREWLEGHIVLLLIRILGMKRFARLLSIGLKQLDKKWAESMVSVIGTQNKKLMLSAWREMMVFDSRQRLADIKCPTLIVAASNDVAVPMNHAKMLHNGITGSQLTIINGADHTLIWTHTDEFVRITEEFLGSEF